jgi:FMN phosphatase YigB (HAD superfamily)
MPQYIFDLDLTLYSHNDFKETDNEVEYYNSFQPKLKLANLLKNTNGRKYILTNANIAHVDEVLDKLQLKNIFDDMMSSDVADSYKPEGNIYHISNHIFQLETHKKNTTDPVYFFEDLAENLQTGKNLYGWKTVLISPNKVTNRNKKYIDYTFDTIENAMQYFKTKHGPVKKKKP